MKKAVTIPNGIFDYPKSKQVVTKTHKICKECKLELPIHAFKTPRKLICNQCLVIRKLEKARKSTAKKLVKTEKKKQKKKAVRTIGALHKRLQKKFNAWIRERDKDLPCISCGQVKDTYHAGHFVAQGMSGFLRYNEDNCHKQCVGCNVFKRGNLLEYRENLIKKIGEDKVNWLWENRKKVHRYKRDELNELLVKYS